MPDKRHADFLVVKPLPLSVIHKFIREATAALLPRRWERPYDFMSPYFYY